MKWQISSPLPLLKTSRKNKTKKMDHQSTWQRYITLWRKFPMPALIINIDVCWFQYWFAIMIYEIINGNDGYFLGDFLFGLHAIALWPTFLAIFDYTTQDPNKDPRGFPLLVLVGVWQIDIISLIGAIIRLTQGADGDQWNLTMAAAVWALIMSTWSLAWYATRFFCCHNHHPKRQKKREASVIVLF